MGSLCSKLSHFRDEHVALSKPTNETTVERSRAFTAEEDQRALVAAAAERRLEEDRMRGVNRANPKGGKLAKKLEEQHRGVSEPQSLPERVIYD